MEPNFREEHAKVTATLVRKFGPQHLESIFDAVQEAFIAALQSWPLQGEPTSPTAWLTTAAERRLIDHLRKTRRETNIPDREFEAPQPTPAAEEDELRLYFAICSPKLKMSEQVCLMLRALGGLTALEIGRLLHESEEAIQRRISRAKNKLTPDDLDQAVAESGLESVLLALYLLFTEGYEASRGEDYIRPELALEALRLANQIASLTGRQSPDFHALLALMHFNISRIPARTTHQGLPILLKDQDPAKIDQHHLAAGFHHLEQSQTATTLSRYHLEAGLAAAIAAGASHQEILYWHELIVEKFPSPIALISHAISVGLHHGSQDGIKALLALRADRKVSGSSHYHAALGYFYSDLNDLSAAANSYQRAIGLSMSAPIKRSLEQKHLALLAET